MIPVDAAHLVVDLRSGNEIKGAVAVDMDTLSVRIERSELDGTTKTEILTMPHGIRVVRRR